MPFDPARFGDDLDAYFVEQESPFSDIVPGAEKRVIWAGAVGHVTEISVLYIHGFSACSEEIRPVPDRVAHGLGANLVFTRMAGHGRGNDAMIDSDVDAWAADFEEGLAAAQKVGQRVLILSTSNGGAITTAALGNPTLRSGIAGLIFVAPCFKIKNPAAFLLTWPAAHIWGPWVAGKRRTFDVRNPAHGTFWATDYPMVSTIQVAKASARARSVAHSQINIPALFFFCDHDTVVRADTIREIADRWGGPVSLVNPELGPEDDSEAHVVTGQVLSPGTVDFASETMLNWAHSAINNGQG